MPKSKTILSVDEVEEICQVLGDNRKHRSLVAKLRSTTSMAVRAVSRDIWEYIFDYVPDDAAKLTLMKSVTVDWNLCLKKKWDKSMLVLRGPCVNCDSQK